MKLTAGGEANMASDSRSPANRQKRTEAFSPIAHKEFSLANDHMSLEVGASQMRSQSQQRHCNHMYEQTDQVQPGLDSRPTEAGRQ